MDFIVIITCSFLCGQNLSPKPQTSSSPDLLRAKPGNITKQIKTVYTEKLTNNSIDTVNFILQYAKCWNFWYLRRISKR